VGPEALKEAFQIDWRAILIQITGFVLLVLALKKLLWGQVVDTLATRQSTIQGDLERALSERQQMEAMRAEYSERLTQVEHEARDRIQSALRDAQQMKDEIVANAHAEAEAQLQRTRDEIQREKQKAVVELRAQVADLAIEAAARILKQPIDSKAQRDLVNEFIGSVTPQ
jgi:F-type H+-transporting ATPase subunit b